MVLSRSCGIALALSLAAFGVCQLDEPVVDPIVGARSLALSPDGNRLAFSYLGDVWVAPATGGRAIPVTNHVEMDDYPVWSPDGRWIAFASNRNGGNDIFVVPADGGRTQRLTWYPGSDIPSDWSSDGKTILLSTQREGAENGIFGLDVGTTKMTRYMLDQMPVGRPKLSADGKKITYLRFGFPWTRPRYQGSAAAQVHEYDLATKKRRTVRDTGFQHLWTGLGPKDQLYAVTVTELTPSSSPLGKPRGPVADNVARTPNVVEILPDGKVRRLTDFVGGGVRYLTPARNADVIEFEYEGDVYRMKPGGKPEKVLLTASTDDKMSTEQRVVLNSGASQAKLSPNGENFVFVAESELWSVPTKQGKKPNDSDALRLTEWAGLDADPVWTPKGDAVFFTSDRDGSESLFRMDWETKKIERVSGASHDVLELKLMPNGDYLSYWQSGQGGGLFKVKVSGGAPEKILDYPRQFRWEADTSYAWSPDSRFMAYAKRPQHAQPNIFVFDTVEKKEYNITKLATEHGAPEFSADGKFLYFVGARETTGLFRVPLQREAAREPDLVFEYKKPEGPVKVEIDFEEIEDRIMKVGDLAGTNLSNLRFDAKTGELLLLDNGLLKSVSYDGETTKTIVGTGRFDGFEFAADGDRVFGARDGQLTIVQLRKPGNPVETVKFRGEYVRNNNEVRKAAFAQLWREFNRGFYDANFHGRDWVAIRKRYAKLIPSVGHRNEFATVLNMMIGELESSHSEIGPAPGNPGPASIGTPGLMFDYSYQGPGIRVLEVPKRSPGAYPNSKIEPGEYIMAIDGKDVQLDENLYKDVLVGQQGRDLTLLVNSRPSKEGAREVKYRSVSMGEWNEILYKDKIDERRKMVDDMSRGQIAYVHIAGMGGGNLAQFNREVWEQIRGKKAVILDVRNNGGGNISEQLIDMIERRPLHYWVLRDGEADYSPANSWDLPTVVLQAETSYSNAEMFPYSMRERGLATTVGMPTPGYVIGTYGLGLLDGTSARMPTWGVYRLDGSPMENQGEVPIIEVPFPADTYLAGKDPQLQKAVEVLEKQIR